MLSRWFRRTFRALVGTQEIVDLLRSIDTGLSSMRQVQAARNEGERATGPPGDGHTISVTEGAAGKLKAMYDRILDPSVDERALGFRREQIPCLISLNGDLLWVPANLLGRLRGLRLPDAKEVIPHFSLGSAHYAWIRERMRPGDVVIDCGAGIGLFALMIAKWVGITGSVHAFESCPEASVHLSRVVRLNEIHWVVVNNCMLSEHSGRASGTPILEQSLRQGVGHPAVPGVSEVSGTAHGGQAPVEATTLDGYVEQQRIFPRAIRIDAKAPAFSILEGGRKCVEWFKPLLVIEVTRSDWSPSYHTRLMQYLETYSYTSSYQDKAYYCSSE